MRVVCPSCGTVYAVPDALAQRRLMRCARCAHEFAPPAASVEAPAVVHKAAVVEVPAPESRPEQAEPEQAEPVQAEPVQAEPEQAEPEQAEPAEADVEIVQAPVLDIEPEVVLPQEEPVAEVAVMQRAGARGALQAQILAAWTASFLMLAMLAGAGLVWRKPVMHAWPPSVRLYTAFGLPPS